MLAKRGAYHTDFTSKKVIPFKNNKILVVMKKTKLGVF